MSAGGPTNGMSVKLLSPDGLYEVLSFLCPKPLLYLLLCLLHSLACFAPQAPFEAAKAGRSNDHPPMEGPSCGLGTVLSSSAKGRYLILIAALQWNCYRILVLGMKTEDQRG